MNEINDVLILNRVAVHLSKEYGCPPEDLAARVERVIRYWFEDDYVAKLDIFE